MNKLKQHTMMDNNQHQITSRNDDSRQPSYVLRRIVFCTVIILIGIGCASYMILNKPKVKRRPLEKTAPLVEVEPLFSQSYTINIDAMGTVIPSREIVLRVPVGGEIVEMDENFVVGGMLTGGTSVLKIDPTDYQLALQKKQRDLTNAEYDFQVEQGRQDVARREWDLLYGDENSSGVESALALRKPHLEKVQAEIKAARAEMELAKINLERTDVSVPFNAMVLNKYVDIGSYVSSQEKLADLIGTDEYWVQVSLPVDRLRWLQIPKNNGDNGSVVNVYYRTSAQRQGKVLRLMADLSERGRMARLLISVRDPLGLLEKEKEHQPLLIGDFVQVSIQGEALDYVYKIPRTALRDNNYIWLAGKDDRLKIRPIQTLWRDEENVLVRDGIQPGDRLIVSGLSAPVDGMPLRTGDEDKRPDTSSTQTDGGEK